MLLHLVDGCMQLLGGVMHAWWSHSGELAEILSFIDSCQHRHVDWPPCSSTGHVVLGQIQRCGGKHKSAAFGQCGAVLHQPWSEVGKIVTGGTKTVTEHDKQVGSGVAFVNDEAIESVKDLVCGGDGHDLTFQESDSAGLSAVSAVRF